MLSEKSQARYYRSVFVSDIHMGTKRAKVAALIAFLQDTRCDQLYLVGDIIDNWSLRKAWYWDQLHNDLIQLVLEKIASGMQVTYIPGNHDDNFRNFSDSRFDKISVVTDAVHVTATGQRYLVLHGDKFDSVVTMAPWLARMGDVMYEMAMSFNTAISAVRRWFKLPYWSLSAYLKYKVKKAVEFISRFEDAVAREAKERGCTGVICGHIHTPDDRMIGDIHYLNDGDWVESCTALVEHFNGRFEIIHANAFEPLEREPDLLSGLDLSPRKKASMPEMAR